MTLNLISTAIVKDQLDITLSSYDSEIAAMIPIVSSDIRRILNEKYDCLLSASFSAGSDQAVLPAHLPLGQVIDSPYTAFGTYLISYDHVAGKYTLSQAATGTGYYCYPTVTIAQYPTIAKMVWYKISKMSKKSADAKGIASQSVGPVSVTYSEAELSKRWDYPSDLLDDLGIPRARIG